MTSWDAILPAVALVGLAFVIGLAIGARLRRHDIQRVANAAFLEGRRSERAEWVGLTGKCWIGKN
jgi:hypothetical protein